MGAMRSCYKTTARPYGSGGPVVGIRWYFTPPGAAVYQGEHVFEPWKLDRDRYIDPEQAGEIPGARQKYDKGAPPLLHKSGRSCGTAADFTGEGRPPLLPNGRPDFWRMCGCSYKAKLGIMPRCRVREGGYVGDVAIEGGYELLHWYGEILVEGEYHLDGETEGSFAAELLIEGEYHTESVSYFGELAIEGQYIIEEFPEMFSGARAFSDALTGIDDSGQDAAFIATQWDTDGYFDLGTDDTALTVPSDGIYTLYWSVEAGVGAGQTTPLTVYGDLTLNGAPLDVGIGGECLHDSIVPAFHGTGTTQLALNAGDVLRVSLYTVEVPANTVTVVCTFGVERRGPLP
jgi:hypothetical protein